MYQPEQYGVVLLLMVMSMLCWGSWANTMKLCPRYPFQLFYWDYTIGLLLAAVAWGLTYGSHGRSGLPFVADLSQTNLHRVIWAAAGGLVFNLANLLLVAAIEIAGMAVAFPIGIGIALIVGSVTNYLLFPQGNQLLFGAGVVLVAVAIICDALAYRAREKGSSSPKTKGIVISIVSGLLMGAFYPFVGRSMQGVGAPGPYAISFIFVCGVALSNIPMNCVLMKAPLNGSRPLMFKEYFVAKRAWHLSGIAGGFVWATGAVLSFVSSRAHAVGPAVSYSLGQGATMISALWGVFVWHEFSGASRRAKSYLMAMFTLFVAGLACLALPPLFIS